MWAIDSGLAKYSLAEVLAAVKLEDKQKEMIISCIYK